MRSRSFSQLASVVLTSFFLAISFNGLVAFAQDSHEEPEELVTPAAPEVKEPVKVETPKVVAPTPTFPAAPTRALTGMRTFETTAYYSPLPGQQKYVTGSYESDMRLNGRGVRGADGTPVYPGMVAAPKVYPFGTKMRVPGVGTVAVHDRGGAIVAAENTGRHDRLDIWMGFGDKGLRRALGWGRRVVNIELLGVDPDVKEQITLSDYDDSERIAPVATSATIPRPTSTPAPTAPKVVQPEMLFSSDVWYMSSGGSVAKLQQVLEMLGHYRGPINGFYDEATRDAVFAFQKTTALFDRADELGAGHTGPQTRIALEKAFNERRKLKIPAKSFGRGAHGDDVLKLQQVLKSLGYDVALTGVFDAQTEAALFKFQKDQSIVRSASDLGAGYFGQKTLSALEKKYVASLTDTQAVVVIDVPAYLVQDLSPNSSGESVRQLQQELMKLNYLRVEPTGFYGPATAHAVFKFKQAQGLVTQEQDANAQAFESSARARMNAIIASRFHVIKTMALVNGTGRGPVIANATPIVVGLEKGSTNDQVKTLQKFLSSKGYLSGQQITGYFGDDTQKALVTFQKSHRIIASEQEDGAGKVGPKTKAFIDAFVASEA